MKVICSNVMRGKCLDSDCSHALPHDPFPAPDGKDCATYSNFLNGVCASGNPIVACVAVEIKKSYSLRPIGEHPESAVFNIGGSNRVECLEKALKQLGWELL